MPSTLITVLVLVQYRLKCYTSFSQCGCVHINNTQSQISTSRSRLDKSRSDLFNDHKTKITHWTQTLISNRHTTERLNPIRQHGWHSSNLCDNGALLAHDWLVFLIASPSWFRATLVTRSIISTRPNSDCYLDPWRWAFWLRKNPNNFILNCWASIL